MLASLRSSCLVGLEAVPVQVEVHLRNGQPRFTIIGLGGAAVRESRERVLTALEHCGFSPPEQILVNLAPADIRKESTAFDLPIAIGILTAMGVVPRDVTGGGVFCGELSLTGELKPLTGVVAHALHALTSGADRIFIPAKNGAEAAMVGELTVVPVENLADLLLIFRGERAPIIPRSVQVDVPIEYEAGIGEVIGQTIAKEALIVAAAGGHNMLMIGPPGCGKSMLAGRLPRILPPLSLKEKLEVVQIHSVAGQSTTSIMQGVRPFRAPHHVISEPGLIGGGLGPRPGEISLAHRGVLFLDEFPEYRRGTLEALRAPMECGKVQLSRARASVAYPARFQLLAAMNPCPCGRLGVAHAVCRCSHHSVREYLSRLSQPILDRIDIQVELEAVDIERLTGAVGKKAESDGEVVEQILAARLMQFERYGTLNSEVSDGILRERSGITDQGLKLLIEATRRLGLSARGYIRLLRVARTIADLRGQLEVTDDIVAQALGYRSLERLHNILQGGSSMERPHG
jgi:magnesium chelatase family protein